MIGDWTEPVWEMSVSWSNFCLHRLIFSLVINICMDIFIFFSFLFQIISSNGYVGVWFGWSGVGWCWVCIGTWLSWSWCRPLVHSVHDEGLFRPMEYLNHRPIPTQQTRLTKETQTKQTQPSQTPYPSWQIGNDFGNKVFIVRFNTQIMIVISAPTPLPESVSWWSDRTFIYCLK